MTYSYKEAQDEWSRFLKDYTNIRKQRMEQNTETALGHGKINPKK